MDGDQLRRPRRLGAGVRPRRVRRHPGSLLLLARQLDRPAFPRHRRGRLRVRPAGYRAPGGRERPRDAGVRRRRPSGVLPPRQRHVVPRGIRRLGRRKPVFRLRARLGQRASHWRGLHQRRGWSRSGFRCWSARARRTA